jgi:hypothetical protein
MTFDKLPNSYVQGERGSTLQVLKNNSISITGGQFLMAAGYVPVAFRAGGVSSRLPAGAIALVSLKTKNETHITLLDSGNVPTLAVTVQNGSLVAMKTGDELTISRNGTARGVTTTNAVTYRTAKTRPDVPMLLVRNMLLNCRSIRLTNAWPYRQLDKRYGVGLASQQTSPPITEKAAAVLVPIAYLPAKPPDSWMSAHAVMSKISEGHYRLSSGTILAHAVQSLTVDTPQGSVTLEHGAVAIVSSQLRMTRVFSLIDHSRRGVLATSEDRTLSVEPGHELALLDATEAQVQRVILSDGIGHKDIKAMQLNPSHGLLTGEFSMGDLLAYHPLLQELRKSADKGDRDLVQSLIKTAAAIDTMELGQ